MLVFQNKAEVHNNILMLFDNKVVNILTTHLTNDTTAPNTGRASLDIFIEYQ